MTTNREAYTEGYAAATAVIANLHDILEMATQIAVESKVSLETISDLRIMQKAAGRAHGAAQQAFNNPYKQEEF